MNAGPDVERLISDWLVEEAPERAPDRILGEASTTIERTKQRRFGAAWREPMMLSTSRLVVAAAVVIAAVVGAGWIGRSSAGVGTSATTPVPPAPSGSPQSPSAGAPEAIPQGTYSTAPMKVSDIIAAMNADTNLTAVQRDHLIDVAFEIRNHTTFVVSLDLGAGTWAQRQSVDGFSATGSGGTYAFFDANTVVFRQQGGGLSGFEVTRTQNGFTLKSVTPAASVEDAFAQKILFETAEFTFVR
jgi:hypothetical protein